MSEPIEVTASSEEQALNDALQQLGLQRDEVEVEVVEQLEGEVRIRVRPLGQAAEPAAGNGEDEEEDELLEDQADAAEDFLNGLLQVIGLEGEAVAEFEEDDTIIVDLNGEDLAVLIGRHGATLDALQELTRIAVQHATGERAILNVDIQGYRARRRAMLERKARTAAEQVRKTKQPFSLEPMSSYERKIVHNALVGVPGVMTTSEGEDPERYIVIRPA